MNTVSLLRVVGFFLIFDGSLTEMDCGGLVFFGLLVVVVVVIVVVALGQRSAGASSPSSSQSTAANRYVGAASNASSRPQPPPRRVRSTPEQCWHGRGEAIELAGFRLPDGMLYFGRDLPPVHDLGRHDVEPALIQPSLPVQSSDPDRSGELDYWPSYAAISPRARAGYLEWLAAGRRNPDAPIGFVFLFFYGIERRVLVDAQTSEVARAEIGGLVDEVEALLAVHGGHPSFRGYASSFVEVGRLLHRSVPLDELEPRFDATGWDVPLSTKLALGAYAMQGEPIPGKWALSWALSAPTMRLRTPAQRCRDEFRDLFLRRYPLHFRGGGLKIKPNKTRLAVQYRAASPSFGYRAPELTLPDLPDVTVLSAPLRALQALVDEVSDELDAYSRWVGRKKDRTSPAALALLPRELAESHQSEVGREFIEAVKGSLGDEQMGIVDTARLIASWPSQSPDKLTKQESTMVSQFLERHRIGIEPDCRFGGPPLGKTALAVVFSFSDAVLDGSAADHGEPSTGYQAAAVLLRLATAVAAADGEISPSEELHLREHLEMDLDLAQAERRRLAAHLRWLLMEPPGLAGLKRRLEVFDASARQAFASFLVAVAAADGQFDLEEIKILRRIYPLLGLDADSVFTDVHALMAGDVDDAGPVTVVAGKPAPGYTIPAPSPEAAQSSGVLMLDPEKIRLTRQATQRISGVLTGIFADDEPVPAATVAAGEPTQGAGVCGLDAAHSAFLVQLAERTSWSRDEIEQLADRLGVLPDGALELINDAAIELAGDPLVEGDETIELDPEVLQEMLT